MKTKLLLAAVMMLIVARFARADFSYTNTGGETVTVDINFDYETSVSSWEDTLVWEGHWVETESIAPGVTDITMDFYYEESETGTDFGGTLTHEWGTLHVDVEPGHTLTATDFHSVTSYVYTSNYECDIDVTITDTRDSPDYNPDTGTYTITTESVEKDSTTLHTDETRVDRRYS